MTKKIDLINVHEISKDGPRKRNERITEILNPMKEEILDAAWDELKTRLVPEAPLHELPREMAHTAIADAVQNALNEFLGALSTLQKHGLMGGVTPKAFIRCLAELSADEMIHLSHKHHAEQNGGLEINVIGLDADDIPPELLEILKKKFGNGS